MTSVSASAQEVSRGNSFDIIRLVAALSVLIAHQLSMAGVYDPAYGPPTLGPWGPKLADAGLYIFFAISGYLNYQSLARTKRLRRFVAARLLRIYPGALVNTVFCIALGAVITSVSQSGFWHSDLVRSYAVHNSLIVYTPTQFSLPGYLTQNPFPAVNTPIWTLKYELVAYLMLVILCALSLLRVAKSTYPIAIAFVAMLICFYITRAYPREDGVGLDSLGDFYFVHVARFFTVFFFGALYAALEPSTAIKKTLFVALFALQILAILISPPMARIIFILIMSVAAIELGNSSLLHFGFYQKIGDLSYGTYLYAFPIQMLTITHFFNGKNFWGLLLFDIAIVLVIAKASWILIERPALQLKSRIH